MLGQKPQEGLHKDGGKCRMRSVGKPLELLYSFKTSSYTSAPLSGTCSFMVKAGCVAFLGAFPLAALSTCPKEVRNMAVFESLRKKGVFVPNIA